MTYLLLQTPNFIRGSVVTDILNKAELRVELGGVEWSGVREGGRDTQKYSIDRSVNYIKH